MKYLKEKLMRKFLLKFPITEGNKINPYVILIDGYTGMEKVLLLNVLVNLMVV